jgi:transcriptional regulator NrdR family protein
LAAARLKIKRVAKFLQGGKTMGMKMQLKVVKADGSAEEYLHTKVIGTISRALGRVGQADMCVAEQLAEVVTYFLYHKKTPRGVTSSEIFSIIKAVLASTKYEDAAIALSEHHFERKLKRSRTEVVSVDIQDLGDAELLSRAEESPTRFRWDKSRIVTDLVNKHGLSRQMARTIASMVEEKIFNMGITLVSASLIKQLVLGDIATVLRAQRQLQTV